jgi:hypothetical protein
MCARALRARARWQQASMARSIPHVPLACALSSAGDGVHALRACAHVCVRARTLNRQYSTCACVAVGGANSTLRGAERGDRTRAAVLALGLPAPIGAGRVRSTQSVCVVRAHTRRVTRSFFLPLSGGADSSAVAAIVGSMCQACGARASALCVIGVVDGL